MFNIENGIFGNEQAQKEILIKDYEKSGKKSAREIKLIRIVIAFLLLLFANPIAIPSDNKWLIRASVHFNFFHFFHYFIFSTFFLQLFVVASKMYKNEYFRFMVVC